MFVGYRITELGYGLLEAYIKGWEFLWVPRVDYNRLRKMALTLNKVSFGSIEGLFVVEPEETDEEILFNLRALEVEGYIEKDILPLAGLVVQHEDFYSKYGPRR